MTKRRVVVLVLSALGARAIGCEEERAGDDVALGADGGGDAGDALGLVSDGAEDGDSGPGGTFGHCCVDDVLLSCFCPANAKCDFGTACADGGCVVGDGAVCPADSSDAESD